MGVQRTFAFQSSRYLLDKSGHYFYTMVLDPGFSVIFLRIGVKVAIAL